MINIAFVNEMSDNCVKFNIDPHEVVRAAASKPYGFMPFKPGIGVGGSCIPVNPYYLFANCDFPLLKMSTKLMEERPSKIAAQFQVKHGTNNHLLICGMAFKPGQSVCTYSQNITFAKCLSAKNHVEVYDPNVLVKDKELEWFEFNRDKQFARFDNILLLFGLDNFPRSFVKHLPMDRVTFVTELC
jgi:UDP-N-acetyl-D-mannosaminuronate dehydrogenase